MKREYIPMRDLRGYMPPKKVGKVIAAGRTERDCLLMAVLWVTGARVSEIVGSRVGLNPDDLIADENIIMLRTLKHNPKRKSKRGKPLPSKPIPERRVSVPAWLMERLLKFSRNTLAETRIFPISRQRVFQIVRDAGAQAGVVKVGQKKIHPHHFRHSHCVAYIRGNNTVEGLRKLQQRLQHADIATTMHYLQFAMEGEHRRVEDIFRPPPV